MRCGRACTLLKGAALTASWASAAWRWKKACSSTCSEVQFFSRLELGRLTCQCFLFFYLMRLTPVALRVSTASTPLTRHLYIHTWRLRLTCQCWPRSTRRAFNASKEAVAGGFDAGSCHADSLTRWTVADDLQALLLLLHGQRQLRGGELNRVVAGTGLARLACFPASGCAACSQASPTIECSVKRPTRQRCFKGPLDLLDARHISITASCRPRQRK
jgi:hypothetical protein